MTEEDVQSVGRMAYVWGWPLVNMANRAASFSKAPEPGLLGGVVPVAFGRNAMLTGYVSPEQTFIACPIKTSSMAPASSRWTKSPIVFQVPDFGDRFWVYPLYDARTDERDWASREPLELHRYRTGRCALEAVAGLFHRCSSER
jgi:hypothetical protein